MQSELIAMAEDDPLGHMLHNASEAEGRHLDSRITVQTYQLARALVEAGVGMTAVDPFTAASADRTRVKVRPLAPSMSIQLYLLTSASAPLAQAARRLVTYLRDAARANLESLE
ncbi:LysR substrate-binding domain-containing protein [Roseateles sp. UC29_93]|uniref:LysR substrate-binding domain-containing protein n=1 Tax=Roseateles sp. UC29_93 TaxID=3350177 RepID=UPI00366CB6A0